MDDPDIEIIEPEAPKPVQKKLISLNISQKPSTYQDSKYKKPKMEVDAADEKKLSSLGTSFIKERGPAGQPELKMKFTDFYWLDFLLKPERLDKVFDLHDKFLKDQNQLKTASKFNSIQLKNADYIRLDPTASYNPWLIASEMLVKSNKKDPNSVTPVPVPTGSFEVAASKEGNQEKDATTEAKRKDMKKLALYIIAHYHYDLRSLF